jgi:hypothetical protein
MVVKTMSHGCCHAGPRRGMVVSSDNRSVVARATTTGERDDDGLSDIFGHSCPLLHTHTALVSDCTERQQRIFGLNSEITRHFRIEQRDNSDECVCACRVSVCFFEANTLNLQGNKYPNNSVKVVWHDLLCISWWICAPRMQDFIEKYNGDRANFLTFCLCEIRPLETAVSVCVVCVMCVVCVWCVRVLCALCVCCSVCVVCVVRCVCGLCFVRGCCMYGLTVCVYVVCGLCIVRVCCVGAYCVLCVWYCVCVYVVCGCVLWACVVCVCIVCACMLCIVCVCVACCVLCCV